MISTPVVVPVIHVIQTRFMQNQPHLYHLGNARLELFRAITIPSMRHQTVQSFVWIIRTDPDLDVRLKTQLIQALEQQPSRNNNTIAGHKHSDLQLPIVILVASNENPEGFRGNDAIADITEQSILVGKQSLEQVRHVHQLAQTQVLLESRLDADDAVAIDFVETVQKDAQRYSWNTTTAPIWRVWCAQHHFEWQYDSPWEQPQQQNNINHNKTGAILGIATGHCITPGLTWGYAPGVHRADIPIPSKHYRISQLLPSCQNENNSNNNEPDNLYDQTQCYVKLGGQLPLAFRARTPTSAGMEAVYLRGYTNEKEFSTKALQHSKFASQQTLLFQSLPTLFGIAPQDLWSVREHIANHLPLIALDALQGQCTKGHSCKKSSKRILQKIISNAAAKQKNNTSIIQ
jgi:hypothetical protein